MGKPTNVVSLVPRGRHNSIATRAMLASLRISKWHAGRTDRNITFEIAQKHNVDAKRAGKYRKNAIDPSAREYLAITSAYSNLRSRHYYWTLPWGADGSRILPAANFDKYSAEMRMLRAEFDRVVAEFVKAFPRLVQEAKRELGAMFDEGDYPTHIAAQFSVEVSIMPLPDAQDFRVDLPDEAINDIRNNITKELEATTSEAMRESFTRLYDYMHRVVERLSDTNPKAPVREALIEGLRELIGIMPALNIANDPMLTQFSERAAALIEGVDVEAIREMPEKRREIAQQAAQIESDMAAFMGSN